MVTDGPIIRFARKKAFEIVDKDENLENSENKLIHDRFNSDYLKLFLNTTVN